jgi:colanic acid/amylovoran biosynthesis glycosyltransferase
MSKLPRQEKWKRRFTKLFKTGDLFLVEGPFMKSRLQDLGCPEEKIQIQRLALPLEKFPWRVRQEKKHGEKAILLFCGRFIEKKGLMDALRAVNEIRRSHDRFEFRIVGDGPQARQVDDFIHAHHLQSCVRRLGVLKYGDYLDEMQKADIFVHPSLTAADGDSEGGAPTTLLEAQASGLPIVTTTHADIPNVVVPGQSALLAPEGDDESLAALIVGLMDRPEAWAAMGRAGRVFVETYHNIDKEAGALETKYRELIEA